MADLNVTLVGGKELTLRLQRMVPGMVQALVRAVVKAQLQLEARIKEKLSGEVLNVVTGALRRSIASSPPEVGRTSVYGRVGSSGDVKYAAIHEFGGTIHIPDIYPTAAKALRFEYGGKTVFAAHVAAHDVVMPERSYIRSSLTDLQSTIAADLSEAARQALKAK